MKEQLASSELLPEHNPLDKELEKTVENIGEADF